MKKKPLKILIVSGPTRERIDPVRFLSNDSTGTMGLHLEKAALKRGHKTRHVRAPQDAESARDLLRCLRRLAPACDVLIMAAAVCDMRPAVVSTAKIKKRDLRSIRLIENPDVLAALGSKKKKNQVFIGFALESHDWIQNGFRKIHSKNIEALFLQVVTKNRLPFGDVALNAYFLERDNTYRHYPSLEKDAAAELIVAESERIMEEVRQA